MSEWEQRGKGEGSQQNSQQNYWTLLMELVENHDRGEGTVELIMVQDSFFMTFIIGMKEEVVPIMKVSGTCWGGKEEAECL